jgi:hypothetical protein
MQKGGLVLSFPHALMEKYYAVQVDAYLNDGPSQRIHSDARCHETLHIGRVIRFRKIPVSNILSSEYSCAW